MARKDHRPLLERGRTALVLAGGSGAVALAAWGFGALGPAAALGLHLVLASVASFVLFAVDKHRAARGARRVSEANLLSLAALGGAAGSLLGMSMLRHKSRHLRFRVLLPLLMIAQIVLVAVVGGVPLP